MRHSHFILFILLWIFILIMTHGDYFGITIQPSASSRPVMITGTSLFAEKIADVSQDMQQVPPVPVRVDSSQPTLAIKAVDFGDIDIGLLSRPLSTYERAHYPRLTATLIGYEAFAIVVSPSSRILGLREEDVRGIFTGSIQDFSEVGGIKGDRIQVLGRKPGEISRNFFRKVALKTDMYTESMRFFDSDEDIIRAMEGPHQETMITALPLLQVPDTLRILSIRPAGNYTYIRPTFETVIGEEYPFIWPLYLISRSDSREDVQVFIRYLTSPDGTDLLIKNGIIPAN